MFLVDITSIFFVFSKKKLQTSPDFVQIFRKFSTVNQCQHISRQLQQRIDQCQERSYSNRCSLLQQQVLKLLDEEFGLDIENQHRLLQALNAVSCEMKDAGDASKMVGCYFNKIQ